MQNWRIADYWFEFYFVTLQSDFIQNMDYGETSKNLNFGNNINGTMVVSK